MSSTVSSHMRTLSLDEPAVRDLTSHPSSARASTSHNSLQATDEDAPEGQDAWTEQTEAAGVAQDGEEGPSAAPADEARRNGDEGDGGFEAVSLDDGSGGAPAHAETTPSRPDSSPSPAPTSIPPLSPATTAATTAANPSSSSLASVPPIPSAAAATDAAPAAEGASPAPPVVEEATSPKPEAATPKKSGAGKSAMQKIISFTRQRDLPPKSKEEEEKHLKQLAEMRAASKEAEKRRRSETEARAAARSASLAAAFPAWESSILPNWRVVLHDDSQGRALRRLWWDGTMPVRYRGRLWALAIGNALAIPKTAFLQAHMAAKKALDDGRIDDATLAALEEDVARTLPALKLFQKSGVMNEDLVDVLLAWTVYEKERPRYARGLAYSAALLLVNMPPSEAFVSLVNLVQKSFLKSFYSDVHDEEDAYYRVFDTLLADYMPKVYANFSAQVVRPSLYLRPWLSELFVGFLPLDSSTRLFDVFLLEGDSFMFRVALVLLQILEPRLFNPNLDDLAAVFAGTDRGAVAVVRREKGLLTPDGGSVEEKDGGVRVEVEDVYVEMGCEEERIFALLQQMDWKEETFARLIERELPEAV
ncbi:hypothetical protein JCM8097_001999 [Rhodosporidiobolus ruineniae]